MDSALAALLRSWTFDPWLITPLSVAAGLYLRGWWRLHCQMPQRFGVWRLVSFQCGLGTLLLALASPLEALAAVLLQAHMTQHLVLMMLAPPLLVYGAPTLPLLRGLPHWVCKRGLGLLLAWRGLRWLARLLTHPVIGWLAFAVSTVAWHVPALYELALHSHFWHHVEHLLYPTYLTVPRLWGISALDDQIAAGVIMWVPGSLAYLVPVGLLVMQLLSVRSSPEITPP